MLVYDLPCRAVLFDSDGVLVDSDASVDRAWRRWSQSYQLDPASVVAAVHGRRASDSVASLLDPAEQRAGLSLINGYELGDAPSVTAIPGAPELVATIPADAWAVVTSGKSALASARLDAAGIGLPDVLICADDVPRGKPAPDGYAAAATSLGLTPAEVVVVEDSGSGVRSARAAGVSAVLGVGCRAVETDADVVVADLREVRWTGHSLRVPRDAVIRHR